MRPKPFQAKHIEDTAVLDVIRTLVTTEQERCKLRGAERSAPYVTASRWDIIEAFAPIPWKIIQAKLTSMKKRRLIDGCVGCTCRGGFKEVVTEEEDLHRFTTKAFICEADKLPLVPLPKLDWEKK